MTQDALPTGGTELGADSRRPRHLGHRDGPGELRRRLRGTMAMLRTIVRTSAIKKRDLDTYVAHLEDRIDALARAQSAAEEDGAVELGKLLTEELLHYGASEGEKLLLSGPDVHLEARAGQVLALAIHELAINAVEHGALGADEGQVEVAWSVTAEAGEPHLTFIWKEWGMSSVSTPSDQGFGTQMLTRTLAYELKAETVFAFEPDGLRCTIRFPLTKGVGYVLEG